MTATAANTTIIGTPINAATGFASGAGGGGGVGGGGANAYLRTKVLTASPEELRLMLLDGAIKFARQGRDGMARKDFEAQYNGISQCRDIVFELLTTIKGDIDPELAANVKGLYTFLYTHLTEASFEKSVEKLDKVIELLEFERETWVMLMQKLADERGKTGGAAAAGMVPSGPVPAGAVAAGAGMGVSPANPGGARPALSIQG